MSDESDDLGAAEGTTETDAIENGTANDAPPEGAGPDFEVETVVAYLRWGALAALLVLAFVAAVSVYASLSTAIDLWVSERYRPFVDAGFNLAVLCASLAGVVALLRRR